MLGDVSGCQGWAWSVVLQGPSKGRCTSSPSAEPGLAHQGIELPRSWSKDLPKNQNCTK